MQVVKITNPHSGRNVSARVWTIEPRPFIEAVKEGKSVRDISWELLSDNEAYCTMEAEAQGDEARSNFALSIFENALDWRLGQAALRYINIAIKAHRKLPKPFKVACTRSGDIFIIQNSGNTYMVERN